MFLRFEFGAGMVSLAEMKRSRKREDASVRRGGANGVRTSGSAVRFSASACSSRAEKR